MAWLPDRLPDPPGVRWRQRLANDGLAGLAVGEGCVIVASRDARDTSDLFLCLDADSGQEKWRKSYLAPGELDYGNSPRATPLIFQGRVYLSGALGRFTCVELTSGKTVWQKDFRKEFGLSEQLLWGFCSSPLAVNHQIVINPGGPDASLVALDPASGNMLWKSPGSPPGHASLIFAKLGGREQLIGYDQHTLGGWDSKSGARLWKVSPRVGHDFNVPTPLIWRDQLLVATENNGTRAYAFSPNGMVQSEPVAHSTELIPDTQTPVIAGDRLFGVSAGLFCLDLNRSLATVWQSDSDLFQKHASLIASPDRVLVVTQDGDLVLLDAAAEKYEPLSSQKIFPQDSGVYSHPAIVGNRLYLRGSKEVLCLQLN